MLQRPFVVEHHSAPLTVQEIVALRKRLDAKKGPKKDKVVPAIPRAERLLSKVEALVTREGTAQLEALLERLGYRLVAIGAEV